MEINCGELKSIYMQITLELADEWLKTSKGNPRWKNGKKLFDKQKVDKIANDIVNGNWNPGNNSIGFNKEGNLLDGHHRLMAITIANIPVFSLVTFGIDKKGELHIDENDQRTVSQRLGTDSKITAVANCHNRMKNGISKKNISIEETSIWIQNHPLIYTAISISSAGTNHPITQKAGVIHGVLCALEYGISEDILSKFINSVNTGFYRSDEETSSIVLRNMLMRNTIKGKTESFLVDCATQYAIKDYIFHNSRRNAYTAKNGYYFDLLVKNKLPGYYF